MHNLVSSPIGFIHLLSALVAIVLGTMVMTMRKGTRTHRRLGYSYVIAMLILNITALMIYRLFGRFGPFHVASVLSLLTLLMGIIPALIRKPKNTWLWYHMAGMYYSTIGLYSAFVSEVAVRIPGAPFFAVVTISTVVIFIIAVWWFQRQSKKWYLSIYLDPAPEKQKK
ncbi:MAG: DUF2306 domain-containing protein [Cyclobacteriaceae bacterium]|nr:DUF2306 domain-containing protein [Cyclobacteriaceae bacterium]